MNNSEQLQHVSIFVALCVLTSVCCASVTDDCVHEPNYEPPHSSNCYQSIPPFLHIIEASTFVLSGDMEGMAHEDAMQEGRGGLDTRGEVACVPILEGPVQLDATLMTLVGVDSGWVKEIITGVDRVYEGTLQIDPHKHTASSGGTGRLEASTHLSGDGVASGTSVALAINTVSGVGALYQALFYPRYDTGKRSSIRAEDSDSVVWVGTLSALFMDKWGNMREDNAPPFAQLTDADYILELNYNTEKKQNHVVRFHLNPLDGSHGVVVDGGRPVDLRHIQPIWNAGDVLAQIDAEDYGAQRRNYTDTASSGRYILTGIDLNNDGQIGMGVAGEVVDFVAASFEGHLSSNIDAELYRLLGLDSTTVNATDESCHVDCEAANIVNYIRGESIAGYRNRRVNVDGDGVKPFLLGDIVYSSPHSVGRPSAGYDLSFADDTYRRFREQYKHRREVVYVGANDGMLHAFNAGFFDASLSAYKLKRDVIEPSNGELRGGESPVAMHPLGGELWAYVPYNLLPHLRWLTEEGYPHVSYVDGGIKHYDVNIFEPDAVHPGGWGTILVVGMRFGGGEYTFNTQDDEFDAVANTRDEITLRSAYIILDVTDPEQPPTVLAEITAPGLGYTLAEPALVKRRIANKSGSYAHGELAHNNWFLVFGSGPSGTSASTRASALKDASSDSPAKLYSYDLVTQIMSPSVVSSRDNGFIGGLNSVDWNQDYIDDNVYFGIVSGTVNAPTGALKRYTLSYLGETLSLGPSDISIVLDSRQAFSAAPLPVRSADGEYWLYAGTGRYFTMGDNFSGLNTADRAQSYYAVKEPKTKGGVGKTQVNLSHLVNTTGITVNSDEAIKPSSDVGGYLSETSTFNDVYASVSDAEGWFLELTRTASRSFTASSVSGRSIVFSEYQPGGGGGVLNALHLKAGISGVYDPQSLGLGSESQAGSHSAAVVYQQLSGKHAAVTQSFTGISSVVVIKNSEHSPSRQSWRELIITQ